MVRKLFMLFMLTVLALTAAISVQAEGPPSAVNPLTGLTVNDPANLALPPALVSIANFPPTARPQAGLSYAPIVYELYIGEGMTRYLAIFYGDYPQEAASSNTASDKQVAQDAAIGPIRSGRISYEKIRQFYNGFLVIASGYQGVLSNLSKYSNYFGSDKDDINSALIPVDKLEEIAEANGSQLDASALSGMTFDATAPDGQPGKVIWLPYSYYNQVFWRYDTASGAYHRFQDNADAQTFTEVTDRLNGQPLAFSNVVILFVEHKRISSTIYDLDLGYINQAPALLFRDGQVHEIFWTTANGDYEKKTGKLRPIRFVDAEGKPFPLKPGQTWIETVTPATYTYETIDSQSWYELKTKKQPDSGIWAIRFMAP